MTIRTMVVLDGKRMREWQTGDTLGGGGVQLLGAQQANISGPTGGLIQDAEARTAINSIIAALQAHGLIASS